MTDDQMRALRVVLTSIAEVQEQGIDMTDDISRSLKTLQDFAIAARPRTSYQGESTRYIDESV